MPDDERRGLEKFEEVYAGNLPAPPAGTMAFFDPMLEQVFAEVWTCEAPSVRDRRLVPMGVIAALGERDTFAVQARAALERQELSPEQPSEMVIHLASDAGYPRAAGKVGVVEKTIGEVAER